MNRIYISLILLIIVFLFIRYSQINEYGKNRELFTDIADTSLPINNIDNFGLKKLHHQPEILLIDKPLSRIVNLLLIILDYSFNFSLIIRFNLI